MVAMVYPVKVIGVMVGLFSVVGMLTMFDHSVRAGVDPCLFHSYEDCDNPVPVGTPVYTGKGVRIDTMMMNEEKKLEDAPQESSPKGAKSPWIIERPKDDRP